MFTEKYSTFLMKYCDVICFALHSHAMAKSTHSHTHTYFLLWLFTNEILWRRIHWLLILVVHWTPLQLHHFQWMGWGECFLCCMQYNEFVCPFSQRSWMRTVFAIVSCHCSQFALHHRQFTAASRIHFPIIVLWEIFSIPLKTGNFWFSASSLTIFGHFKNGRIEAKWTIHIAKFNLHFIDVVYTPTNERTNETKRTGAHKHTTILQQVLQKCCVFHVLLRCSHSSLIWRRSIEFYTRLLRLKWWRWT